MTIIKNTVISLFVLLAISCTDEDGARKTLERNGYTDIRITGWEFKCSEDDGTCTGFVATSPSGHRVSGAVSGSFVGCKGHTIRFD